MDQIEGEEKTKSKTRDNDWSEIYSDALQLILESLIIPDFHRARTVCLNWYSVSKSCVAGSRNRYPWLISFPEKFSVSETCTLFDPVEEKTYKTRDLGDELSESRCVASYGNWLLMLNPRLDFSVVNVFTGEKINLPPLSLRGKVRFIRKNDGDFFLVHSNYNKETIINRYIKMAVLWIDEKTKDYVVSWIYNDQYLFSYKNGDDSWWHLENTKCLAMAYSYKNQKLFVYSLDHHIKILDFSVEFSGEVIEEENPYSNHPFNYIHEQWEYMWKRRIAITDSGDVLIILSLKAYEGEEKRLFYIFKMNLEGTEWERVESLGNETLVFGDGFTIVGGLDRGRKKDSIYFVADDVWPPQNHTVFPSSTGVFDVATTKISWSRVSYKLRNTRWFTPGSDK